MKSQKEGRMVPESNESLEKLVLLIPKSRRITVTDIRAITGSITGPLIWRSLELGRGEGFITGWGGGWLRGGIEHPPRLWNPEDRPLILCAHENLRELWQAAVLVFENAFPPKPSPPLPPLPRRITGIHARIHTILYIFDQRKESENGRTDEGWAVFNWEESSGEEKGGRGSDANRPTGRDMQADDRSAVRQRQRVHWNATGWLQWQR